MNIVNSTILRTDHMSGIVSVVLWKKVVVLYSSSKKSRGQ